MLNKFSIDNITQNQGKHANKKSNHPNMSCKNG
jgi:hypothetical protein